MEKIIQFDKVEIKINDKKNLNNINLKVDEKDFIYLIGKTGSGKSSILRAIYADMPINIGEAKVLEYNLTKIKRKEIPFLRRKIGVIFQDFKLLMDRTIYDNLAFVLKATGWNDNAKIKARVEKVLDMVNVEEQTSKYPFQLSGGEQQRVAIARALLNDPEIILADEPTGNLDPETSQEIMQLFKQLHQKGMTIIMATHDYNMIIKFPGKILKCEKKQIFEVVAKS